MSAKQQLPDALLDAVSGGILFMEGERVVSVDKVGDDIVLTGMDGSRVRLVKGKYAQDYDYLWKARETSMREMMDDRKKWALTPDQYERIPD